MRKRHVVAVLTVATAGVFAVIGVVSQLLHQDISTEIAKDHLAPHADAVSNRVPAEAEKNNQKEAVVQDLRIRRIDFSRSISEVDAPEKPAWELIQSYLKGKSPDLEQGVLSALSYCANQQGIQNSMQEVMQDRGEVSTDLADVSGRLSRSCQRLNDQDYLLRKEIVERGILNGSEDAKIAFFNIGPFGKWPVIDSREQENSAYSYQLRLWSDKAIGYMKDLSGSDRPEIDAYFSTIYEARSGILQSHNDPVLSYAYKYLWAASTLANKAVSTSAKENVLQELKRAEGQLERQQVSQAREVAAQIYSERGMK